MKLHIRDIVEVLKQYKDRYRWLDVFASEVQELTAPTKTKFSKISDNVYQLVHTNQPVELVLDRERDLARFRLLKDVDPLQGAVIGAGIGALVVAATSRTNPTGMLLGLLVGGLIGAGIASALGEEEPQIDENRILTLSFEPQQKGWKVYHGPYRDYAKEALYPKEEG